jgi:hypothetical protein
MTPNAGDIYKEGVFTAGNNIDTPTAVTGFAFANANVRGFTSWISTAITSTSGNQAAWYTLIGIQKNTSGSWVLNSSFVGDNLGVNFSINASGQILYTSTNNPGFVSNTMKFEARSTSV